MPPEGGHYGDKPVMRNPWKERFSYSLPVCSLSVSLFSCNLEALSQENIMMTGISYSCAIMRKE